MIIGHGLEDGNNFLNGDTWDSTADAVTPLLFAQILSATVFNALPNASTVKEKKRKGAINTLPVPNAVGKAADDLATATPQAPPLAPKIVKKVPKKNLKRALDEEGYQLPPKHLTIKQGLAITVQARKGKVFEAQLGEYGSHNFHYCFSSRRLSFTMDDIGKKFEKKFTGSNWFASSGLHPLHDQQAIR
ncbi:hypothetical protein NPIL_148681 [Nephila pilipes]|uniref:Uncharacterized protein n=1 Tax=Nephila pilipes TaxID=299642 RepID=A0A8X6U959_NEPPI|nr:hypothetical protein NPIL_148681 [Nephila pilipes]